MDTLLFKTTISPRMHDIDAAGVVFFARIFYYVHDAYEMFLNSHQLAINNMMHMGFILPIRHVEADFQAPIFLNEHIVIEIYRHEIKESEFTLNYRLVDETGKIRATALSRHVCVDNQTGARMTLTDSMMAILK